MANAFSTVQSMGRYIDPLDGELMSQVLSYKDKKYDYNLSKIDGLIQQYTNLPLARDEDKQYLKQRLDTLVNTVNKVSKLDMSDNNFTRQIEQTIGTAIDDRVIEQVANTQSIMNFEQTVAKKREKSPALYSDINYSFAKEMAGYSNYMKGQDAQGNKVDSIGNLQYVDYKDVPKKINDFIIDVQNKKKEQVVQIPARDGNGDIIPGQLIQTTISGLTPFQVRELAESQLDADYNKQIQINGWYNSGGYEGQAKEKLASDVSSVFDNQVKNLDAKKIELERKINTAGISENDIKNYQLELDGVSNKKAVLEKNKDYLISSPSAAATYLEKERVLTNAQDAFGSLYSENSKIVKDEVYFAQQDLNLKKLKLQYDIEKDKKTAGVDASAPNAVVNVLPTTTEDTIPEIESFIDKSVDTYNKSINTDLATYRNALKNEASKGNQGAISLIAEYNKKLATKAQSETEDDVFGKVVSTIDYNDANAIIGNRNYVADIKNNKERLSLLLEGKKQAIEEGKISHVDATLNTPETFKAFNDNPNTKMLWYGSDNKLRPYAVKDVLKASGLMDAQGNKTGDIKTKPTLLKYLQQSFYADQALSNRGFNGTTSKAALENLAISLGENPNDVIISGGGFGGGGDTLRKEYNSGYTTKEGSKTKAFLLEAQKNGIYDTINFSDQSLSEDDSTISRFVREDYKSNDLYKENLKKFYDRLPTTQMIGITAQDKAAYNRLGALVTSQPGSTFTPEALAKNATINLRLDGDYVIASQNQDSTQKGVTTTAPVQTRILKSNFLRNMPELSQKLDFNTEAAFYTLDKLEGKTLKSEPIKFFNQNTDAKTFEYSTKVLLNKTPQLIPYADASSARTTLLNGNRILSQKYQNFPEIINNALSESSNYAINAKVEKGFDGAPIMDIKLVDKRSQKVIHTMRNSGEINLDNFKQVLDGAPQVFYGILINDIFKREQEEMNYGGGTSPSFKSLTDSL